MSKQTSKTDFPNDLDSSDEDELYMKVIYKNMFDHNSSSNNCDSDSSSDGLLPKKRRRLPGQGSSTSSSTENEEASSPAKVNEFGPWKNVTDQDNEPPRIPFTLGSKIEGPQIPLNCTEPLDFFKLYFTDSLIENIVEQTNTYARDKISKKKLSKRSTWHTWTPVTKEELTAFIGVTLNMGTIPLANIQEYWSTRHNARIPFFSDIFRRERFMQLFWMLHLHQNVTNNRNIRTRREKVSHYLEYLNSRFKVYFIPGREICVDESTVKFKGTKSAPTYSSDETTGWHVRLYVLADANSGYIFSVLPYYGSSMSKELVRPDLPVNSRIVLHLYQQLLDTNMDAKGYHIYTNRHHTSLLLAKELLKLNCHLTGTIRTNRKHVPNIIKKPIFSKNNTFACRSENMLLLAWKDDQFTTVLSSWDVAGIQAVNKRICDTNMIQRTIKPNVIVNYHKYIGKVRYADSYTESYCFMRKSLKWWRKLFFSGLELCSVNSYLLHKITQERQNKSPMSRLKFVRKLVDQLVGNFREGSEMSGKPSTSDTVQRLNGRLHIIRKNPEGKSKDCIVCSDREAKDGRRRSNFVCVTCDRKPALHIGDCFQRYHTLADFKI